MKELFPVAAFALTTGFATAQGIRVLQPLQELLPATLGAGDSYGHAVGLSGDVAVVTALNGDEGRGIAHVFERDAKTDTWLEVAALKPRPNDGTSLYGFSAAVSGDVIAIAAPGEHDLALSPGEGAVYVYERDLGGTGAWGERTVLRPIDAETQYGFEVALSGDTLVVGAPGGTGFLIQGGRGKVHVFERDLGGPGVWGESAELSVPTGANHLAFGMTVALDGDRLAAGRLRRQGGVPQAWVHLFERDSAGAWRQTDVLQGSGTRLFRSDLSLSGDTLAVNGRSTKEILVLERDASGTWLPRQVLREPRGCLFEAQSVCLSGDTLAAGYPNCGALGTFGTVFLYQRGVAGGGTRWRPTVEYTAGFYARYVGVDVAISAGRLLAGAPQSQVLALDSGNAYVFRWPSPRYALAPPAWLGD